MDGRVYCSSLCRDNHRRTIPAKANPRYARVTVACATCGKSIEVQPNRIKRRPDHYCSKECGREGHRKKLRNVLREASHWRTLAKRHYGGVCVICQFEHAVEVHHIVPRSKGGSDDIENLVPLCPNHHTMAHLGLLSEHDLKTARPSPNHNVNRS